MTGNYTVTKPSFERAVATFSATVDPNWAATISPSTVTISGNVGGSGIFTVTVVVPAGSLPSEVGLLGVYAAMTSSGIMCQGDSVEGITITPLPYFDGLSAKIAPANVTLTNGVGSFTLALSASANVPVTATLNFSGPSGLSFSAPATVGLPAPGKGPMNATVTVRLRATDAIQGTQQVQVVVKGSTSQGLTQQVQIAAPLDFIYSDNFSTNSVLAIVGVSLAAVGAVAYVFWWRRR